MRKNESEDLPFTIKQLKNAIPPHCFQPSLFRSFSYLLMDLFIVILLFYLACTFLVNTDHYWGWPIYWVLQGSSFMALWVIGHECGHHAFSKYKKLDDSIGLILHTVLLVPYFAWQLSHASHHRNNANLDNDEVHVPGFEGEVKTFAFIYLVPILPTILSLFIGWPYYLLFNRSAGKRYDTMNQWVNHFNPSSPIFLKKDFRFIVYSNVALILFFAVLVVLSYLISFKLVLFLYLIPYFFTNCWLVLYTLLHHTDLRTTYYRGASWSWLKGALSTVDRDYGVFDSIHHQIGSTHVCHHLFSNIPHYYAREATEAIKPILGDYYHKNETPILKTLFQIEKKCQVVFEAAKDVYCFNTED